MSLSLTCRRCNAVMTGEDGDDLVTQVQAHVADHSRDSSRLHVVTREQILARVQAVTPQRRELIRFNGAQALLDADGPFDLWVDDREVR